MHFQNPIALIPDDKWLHFVYSAALFLVFLTLFSIVTSIVLSLLAGFVKELWDWRYGTGFCLYDLLANIAGIAFAYFFVLFITPVF